MKRQVRIGIDVGGTFTDLFLCIAPGNAFFRHKLPSTPANAHQAPITGILQILEIAGVAPEEVEFVGLGTTVATNALLERKGAKTALVTTLGFRDVLENGRQARPHVYNLHVRKPAPLVPRELRMEVTERIGADGEILIPLDKRSLQKLVQQRTEHDRFGSSKCLRHTSLQALGIESIGICFLNSYKNDRHERECANFFRRVWPDCPLSVSSEIMPEFREYERVSTVAVNAFLTPLMKRYLSAFQEEVTRIGVRVTPFVMNSGGGVVSPALASARPVDTLLSGPSGGVAGAAHLAKLSGHSNVITFDMGGTSTDVALLRDCKYELATQRVINGLPFKSAAIDIHSVGAGGSSIAWIDDGGMLRVGPESAGAAPGPACYRRGGSTPTVTDVNVVLGRLNDKYLLGGQLEIDAAASFRAVNRKIARPRKIDVEEAAKSIIAIANQNIAEAIRFVSVSRGIDPREFVLVAFGGAGPIHAAEVARELDMTAVLIPESPGVLCAMGVLTKDIRVDTSRTVLLRESARELLKLLKQAFADAEARAVNLLSSKGRTRTSMTVERSVDVRYVGQNHELPVVLLDTRMNKALLSTIRERFDAAHRRLFGYDLKAKEIEIVNVRAAAIVPVPRLNWVESRSRRANAKPKETRRAYFSNSDDKIETAVFVRDQLTPGMRLRGPAIVEQFDATTLIPPDFDASVDGMGNLILACRREN